MFLHPPFLGPIQQPISFIIMSETYISNDWLNQINFTKKKSIFVKWCYIFIMWQKDSPTYHQMSWFWGHIILTILGEASLFILTMHYVCLIEMQLQGEEGFKIFSDLENCPMPLKKKKNVLKKISDRRRRTGEWVLLDNKTIY